MLRTRSRAAYIFSAIIAPLAALASAGGLFVEGFYRDNNWSVTQFRGNDLVTLALAVPVLAGTVILTRRGSVRAQLVWLGMLWYMLYNYTFYLFGSAFNRFFLVYVALFALSLYALIFSLAKLDVEAVAGRFGSRTPVKWISSFMVFLAVMLGGMWISQCVGFIFSGNLPTVIVNSGSPTNVVFATDLALLVPALVLVAVWLWKRQPWGYVLGSILLVKCITYGPALIGMSIFAAVGGTLGDDWVLVPLWVFLTLLSAAACWAMFKNVQLGKAPEDSNHAGEELPTYELVGRS